LSLEVYYRYLPLYSGTSYNANQIQRDNVVR
jgi:hypothetical protein